MSSELDTFWDAVDAELARYPMAPELQPLPMRSTDSSTTYAVRLTSLGPYRIFGYYSVPKGSARAPGLLLTPRYGSVNPSLVPRGEGSVLASAGLWSDMGIFRAASTGRVAGAGIS